ncbi:hypothetical protein HJB99_08280 [Rhizobium sp. NLR17b]|uniref:hypothetical protein n=1 Tax=Rhizobium sp. NLR17b TaxID=2731114 RepID=UPI001C8386C9|nr:hypothetical protein [Rhizobium sp. NLR17b]MBX5268670.1 hypothetical protein [Rhizobium sp. NLR17b]
MTVLMDNQYTRDKLGRIKTTTGLAANDNWTYGYDDLSRLTGARILATTPSTRPTATTPITIFSKRRWAKGDVSGLAAGEAWDDFRRRWGGIGASYFIGHL